MRPLLRAGRRVAVELLAPDAAVRPGEILLFRAGDCRLVLHRLVGLRPGGLLARGDNSLTPDPLWGREQLRGRLVAAEAAPGRWICPRPVAGRLIVASAGLPRPLARVAQFLLSPLVWLPHKGGSHFERSPEPSVMDDRWEVQQLGTEWAVYDSHTQAVHILNRTAHFIWTKRRDGLDKDRILDEMKHVYPDTPSERLKADLEEALVVLGSAEMI